MGLIDSKWVVLLYSAVMLVAMLRWAWNMLWPHKKWDWVTGFLALMSFATSWVAYHFGNRNSWLTLSVIWIAGLSGVILHVISEGWLPEPAPVSQDRSPGFSRTAKRQARRRRLRSRR